MGIEQAHARVVRPGVTDFYGLLHRAGEYDCVSVNSGLRGSKPAISSGNLKGLYDSSRDQSAVNVIEPHTN